MGFLRRIFGNNKDQNSKTVAFIKGSGAFDVDIVGESSYQSNLERICGPRSRSGEQKVVTATLILEDNNVNDNQAVRVDVDGLTVGYFTQHGAREFRKALQQTPIRNQTIQCKAMIVGGWKRGNDFGHYGVKLDLPHD